jgi:hypothetical protein
MVVTGLCHRKLLKRIISGKAMSGLELEELIPLDFPSASSYNNSIREEMRAV